MIDTIIEQRHTSRILKEEIDKERRLERRELRKQATILESEAGNPDASENGENCQKKAENQRKNPLEPKVPEKFRVTIEFSRLQRQVLILTWQRLT